MRRFVTARRIAVVLAGAVVGVVAGLSSASAAPQAHGTPSTLPPEAQPVKTLWTRTSRTHRDDSPQSVSLSVGL